MTNLHLYEINQQIRDVMDQVDEDGMLPDSSFDLLNDLNIAADIKYEALACLIKEFSATSKMLKEEADKLTGRQKAYEAKADRAKKYLADQMTIAGRSKFESARCAISFRTSNGVVIDNENDLPQEYFKVKCTPDVTAIKESLQAGNAVPGARIEVRQNLQVK